jgi:hypothetical protein
LNTALSAATEQFRAFQALLRQGQPSAGAEAAERAEALLSRPLSPIQRALVLQLRGDLQQILGNSEAAERDRRASLELRFSPELALRQQDPALLAALQAQGQSRALARSLAARLKSLPLDQQRRALLAELEQQPSLRPLAKQLQRLMPPG